MFSLISEGKQKRPPLPPKVKMLLIYYYLANLQDEEEPISASKIADWLTKTSEGFEEYARIVRKEDVIEILENMSGIEIVKIKKGDRTELLCKLSKYKKDEYSGYSGIMRKIASALMEVLYKKRARGE